MREDEVERDDVVEPAITQLLGSHREFLSFLERRLGDRSLAEDILQDAFVKSIERSEALESVDSVRSWFFTVLRNAVVDHHRRAGTRRAKLEGLAAELDVHCPSEEAERAVCACIAGLVPTLKPEYAEALRRIELEGLSVKDFAGEAGITRENAAVRVFRARAALRKQVARACGTCAKHGCEDCSCRGAEAAR